MAKRKKAKAKRPSLRVKSGLSKRTYETLKKEATNARKRISDFLKRDDADLYQVPSTSDYTLASLINRIITGETSRSILKEVRGLTAQKIRSGTPLDMEGIGGYKLSKSESDRLRSAVKEANKNIRVAKKAYPGMNDVFPDEFKLDDVVGGLVSSKAVETKIVDLALFSPENLVPVAVNEAGEAGTMAEKQYYTNILQRENERRAKIREETEPGVIKGFLRMQADYDREDIDIEKIPTREKLKKRAITWDDPARIYRANLFLKNYSDSLNILESLMRMNGMVNDTIEQRFDYIRDVILRIYNDEDAITHASTRVPGIDISIISPGKDEEGNVIDITGYVNFNEIYEAWIYMEDTYL